MPAPATVYRVLIASPSDVTDERAEVANALHSLNSSLIVDFGATVLPIIWETDAIPEMGDRPQGIINRQLVDQSDILVGIFWSRLGTPTGFEPSGTVEEIERCISQNKRVHLYFASASLPNDSDLDEVKRLRGFRNKCETRGIFARYADLTSLRTQVERHIRSSIRELQSLRGESGARPVQVASDGTDSWLRQYQTFLTRFTAEWRAERDSGPENIDGGKRILSRAYANLVSFRAQPAIANDTAVAELVDGILRELRALDRHRLFLDGGRSFIEFWDRGNAVIDRMEQHLVGCHEEYDG